MLLKHIKSRTFMSIEKLINWRQVSKIISDSRSETAIRMNDCPKKYSKPIEGLLIAVQNWHREYVIGASSEKKYTITEIKDKLNNVEW